MHQQKRATHAFSFLQRLNMWIETIHIQNCLLEWLCSCPWGKSCYQTCFFVPDLVPRRDHSACGFWGASSQWKNNDCTRFESFSHPEFVLGTHWMKSGTLLNWDVYIIYIYTVHIYLYKQCNLRGYQSRDCTWPWAEFLYHLLVCLASSMWFQNAKYSNNRLRCISWQNVCMCVRLCLILEAHRNFEDAYSSAL